MWKRSLRNLAEMFILVDVICYSLAVFSISASSMFLSMCMALQPTVSSCFAQHVSVSHSVVHSISIYAYFCLFYFYIYRLL